MHVLILPNGIPCCDNFHFTVVLRNAIANAGPPYYKVSILVKIGYDLSIDPTDLSHRNLHRTFHFHDIFIDDASCISARYIVSNLSGRMLLHGAVARGASFGQVIDYLLELAKGRVDVILMEEPTTWFRHKKAITHCRGWFCGTT